MRRLLSRLSTLKSLSINNTSYHNTETLNSSDVVKALAQILSSVPSSVVNLEVVLNNVLLLCEHDHLCEALSTLLPQLETLRILLPTICEGFLRFLRGTQSGSGSRQVPVPRFRYATIWTNWQVALPAYLPVPGQEREDTIMQPRIALF